MRKTKGQKQIMREKEMKNRLAIECVLTYNIYRESRKCFLTLLPQFYLTYKTRMAPTLVAGTDKQVIVFFKMSSTSILLKGDAINIYN
jgi:hypothetical protein